jgi:hypothetical protein
VARCTSTTSACAGRFRTCCSLLLNAHPIWQRKCSLRQAGLPQGLPVKNRASRRVHVGQVLEDKVPFLDLGDTLEKHLQVVTEVLQKV